MNFLDKYKGNFESTNKRSVYDILALDKDKDWEVIRQRYVAHDIDKVVIGGNTFTNYGDFQFMWEKSYVKSPERSADGSIGNLNSYATFRTPHLIINFSIMSIDDYRQIMRMDLEQNEFIVECYDPIYNTKFKGKMYFGTPEMAKLAKIAKVRFDGEKWEDFVELFGVQDYTVELIGTNADVDLISVIYHLNPPSGVNRADETIADDDIYSGEEVVIGSVAEAITSETFDGRYKFSKWNISENDPTTAKEVGNYLDGYAYTINKGDEVNVDGKSAFHLYAQWNPTDTLILTLNYGIADEVVDANTREYITHINVNRGVEIGALPYPNAPAVSYKDKYGVEQTASPYVNGAWYKTPVKTINSVAVTSRTPYWKDTDGSIYYLFDNRKYHLMLYLDFALYSSSMIEYNSPMNLPSLVSEDKVFDGWYYNNSYSEESKFVGSNMPPQDIVLYARWVQK